MDGRILQMHTPTEVISPLSFALDSHHLLWAGISHRWLRLFDIRTHVPSTTNVATKAQGVATGPFVPVQIATFGDGIVSIWDSRRLPQPILTFSEHEAYGDGAEPYLLMSGMLGSTARARSFITKRVRLFVFRFPDHLLTGISFR